MKKIDERTGEVIDTDLIVKQEMNALITDDLLEQITQLKYLEEQIDTWKFKHKEAIKEIFKRNGIKSFKNDYINITYVAPTIRKSVDTKALKEAGLYDLYSKETPIDEQIRIKLKED